MTTGTVPAAVAGGCVDGGWAHAIDVCEHHCIDFDTVVRQGVSAVIVRAGRGTRQDARWVETVMAARRAGAGVGSYWHVYPSRVDPHRQAALWAAAITSVAVPFGYGHWADVSEADGFEPFELGRYLAAFLRRADELVGTDERGASRIGVFTDADFWRRRVRFDDPDRRRWIDAAAQPPDDDELDSFGATGVRTAASDRGGPGRHRVRGVANDREDDDRRHGVHLVTRGVAETPEAWRRRWTRTPDVALLQMVLNDLGASLIVDGVYGPATDSAARTFDLLRRRDGVEAPPAIRPLRAC